MGIFALSREAIYNLVLGIQDAITAISTILATKGQPSGFASLDSSGTVPLSQLPSIPTSKITGLDNTLALKADLDRVGGNLDVREIPEFLEDLYLQSIDPDYAEEVSLSKRRGTY
jgi:hypothetical protein